MKTAILALGLVFVAGCGTNVGGTNVASGVSLAEARAVCDAWDPAPGIFDAFVLTAEAFRDSGGSEIEFSGTWAISCESEGCLRCGVNTAAAVWN